MKSESDLRKLPDMKGTLLLFVTSISKAVEQKYQIITKCVIYMISNTLIPRVLFPPELIYVEKFQLP